MFIQIFQIKSSSNSLLYNPIRIKLVYLEHASCFKDISISESKCSKVLNRFQEISKMLSTITPSERSPANHKEDENLRQFCCAYQESVDCQLKNVRQYCGQKGLKFFERYMAEMTNSLINEHCIGYTYSDKCRLYQDQNVVVDVGVQLHNQMYSTQNEKFKKAQQAAVGVDVDDDPGQMAPGDANHCTVLHTPELLNFLFHLLAVMFATQLRLTP